MGLQDIKLEEAIQTVYGFDIVYLENTWRNKIGAEKYIDNKSSLTIPTAEPIKTIKPFSLNDDSAITRGGGEIKSEDKNTSTSSGCNLFSLNDNSNADLSILGLLIFLILFKSKRNN